MDDSDDDGRCGIKWRAREMWGEGLGRTSRATAVPRGREKAESTFRRQDPARNRAMCFYMGRNIAQGVPIWYGQVMDSSLIALVIADLTQRSVLEHVLRREGFDVTSHGGAASFRAAARGAPPDAVLLDATLPEAQQGSLVRWVQGLHPGTSLVLLHERGASLGPLEPAQLAPTTALAPLEPGPELLLAIHGVLMSARLARRVRSLERRNSGEAWAGVLGRSPTVRALEDRLDPVAASEVTIHLYGEPGAGKGLVARALHSLSRRRDRPLVALDGREVDEGRIATLLGGEPRGSRGSASGGEGGVGRGTAVGTLVLRRLDEMAPPRQQLLVDLLRNREATRTQEMELLEAEARLILVNRRPPSEAVGEGRLREDLYRELRGVEVRVPPLRERPEDILLLVDHFSRVEAPDRTPIPVTKEAADRLVAYRWPGNVRELGDVVRRALLICADEIGLDDLPEAIRRGPEPRDTPGADGSQPPEGLSLRALERWAIRRALASSDGNMTEAAALLGIGRTTLYRKLDAYGLR